MNNPIIINNKHHPVDVESEMPLLWFLRDHLAYTGTKFGCGIGVCGACTVHIDGVAMRSCIMTMSSVVGKKITTIEGLSEQGDHPVQQAWLLPSWANNECCEFFINQQQSNSE